MIDCKLLFNTKEYTVRPHAYQAIAGFIALKKQKIISLTIDYKSKTHIHLPANTFRCKINNKEVFYDVEDGAENLSPDFIDYLHQNKAIVFKRAYDEKIFKDDILIRPYGLNYNKSIKSIYEQISFPFVNRGILSPRLIQSSLSKIKDWSMLDNTCGHEYNILFCTRLWSQKNTHFPVDELNETRIQSIISLRRAFHRNIMAGVSDSPLSRKMCKDLILPSKVTDRKNYLGLIGKSCVCVTTTGLHRSIGWRFGEYVASGKAIISEPLFFSVPGDFHEKQNYLSFTSTKELTEQCDCLLSDPEKRRKMEQSNINYYIHNLRPDVLIWNTIKQVIC